MIVFQCIMAHGVHLTDREMSMFARKGASIAHCPASNTRLRSGLCPVRKLLDSGIKVGLGTGTVFPYIFERMETDIALHPCLRHLYRYVGYIYVLIDKNI